MLLRRALLFLVLAAPIAFAQSPAAPSPVFEVISVKPDKLAQGWTSSSSPDGYTAKGITLATLLMDAYNIRPDYRIVGAPSWWQDSRFDIQAKVSDSDIPALKKLDFRQRAAMVQQILADRFKLRAHRETRPERIYSLVLVKPGLLTDVPPSTDGMPTGMDMRPGRGGRAGQMVVTTFTTAWLASNLSGIVGRVVVDNTGLTGTYHADLHWTPDNGPSAASQPASDNPISIFTALEEQVGLKLQPSKGPVECLIIDHVELPGEN